MNTNKNESWPHESCIAPNAIPPGKRRKPAESPQRPGRPGPPELPGTWDASKRSLQGRDKIQRRRKEQRSGPPRPSENARIPKFLATRGQNKPARIRCFSKVAKSQVQKFPFREEELACPEPRSRRMGRQKVKLSGAKARRSVYRIGAGT
jgi:hypothetical protein